MKNGWDGRLEETPLKVVILVIRQRLAIDKVDQYFILMTWYKKNVLKVFILIIFRKIIVIVKELVALHFHEI